MLNRLNLYIEDENFGKAIERYSKRRKVNLQHGVKELSGAALEMLDEFGTINVEVIREKIQSLKESISALKGTQVVIKELTQANSDLRSEILKEAEFRRRIGKMFERGMSSLNLFQQGKTTPEEALIKVVTIFGEFFKEASQPTEKV